MKRGRRPFEETRPEGVEEFHKKLLELRQQNLTYEEIAKIMGCNSKTISKNIEVARKKYLPNVESLVFRPPKRGSKWAEVRNISREGLVLFLQRLRQNGNSLAEISKQTGIPLTTIAYYLQNQEEEDVVRGEQQIRRGLSETQKIISNMISSSRELSTS